MRTTFPLCGYFKKFVQREIAKGSGASVYNPLLGWKHKRKQNWIFDENLPWTDAAKESNLPGKRLNDIVEPISERSRTIFIGDTVQILKGVDKGKQGIVCSLINERNWCYVEGLNCIYKWAKKTSTNPGFMTKVEKPLLVTTEVALVDPSDQQPTEVEWRYTEDGERVRVSLRSGRVLPKSQKAPETEDLTAKWSYKEQSCDTKEDEVTKVTFKPSLQPFEQSILASYQMLSTKDEKRKRSSQFYYHY